MPVTPQHTRKVKHQTGSPPVRAVLLAGLPIAAYDVYDRFVGCAVWRRGRLELDVTPRQLAFVIGCTPRWIRAALQMLAERGLVWAIRRPGRHNLYILRAVSYPQVGSPVPTFRALPSAPPEPVTPPESAPRRPAVSDVPRTPARQRAALAGLRPGVQTGRRLRQERCDECGESIPGGRQAWISRFRGPFWHLDCAPRRE